MLGPKTDNAVSDGDGNNLAGRDIVINGTSEQVFLSVVRFFTERLEAAIEAKHEAEKASLKLELENLKLRNQAVSRIDATNLQEVAEWAKETKANDKPTS